MSATLSFRILCEWCPPSWFLYLSCVSKLNPFSHTSKLAKNWSLSHNHDLPCQIPSSTTSAKSALNAWVGRGRWREWEWEYEKERLLGDPIDEWNPYPCDSHTVTHQPSWPCSIWRSKNAITTALCCARPGVSSLLGSLGGWLIPVLPRVTSPVACNKQPQVISCHVCRMRLAMWKQWNNFDDGSKGSPIVRVSGLCGRNGYMHEKERVYWGANACIHLIVTRLFIYLCSMEMNDVI